MIAQSGFETCFPPLLKKQGRIHGISRSPSSFLPSKKEVTDRPTDQRMDRRTDGHTLLESWLTTKDSVVFLISQAGHHHVSVLWFKQRNLILKISISEGTVILDRFSKILPSNDLSAIFLMSAIHQGILESQSARCSPSQKISLSPADPCSYCR